MTEGAVHQGFVLRVSKFAYSELDHILTSEIFLEVEFVSRVCKEGFGNGVDAIDNIICFHASIIPHFTQQSYYYI